VANFNNADKRINFKIITDAIFEIHFE
jgi:hypothetical protein